MLKIKELREEKGLSQLEVAKGIDTSQRNIGRWESGANEPSSSFVLKLAKYFNVSTDYLLGCEDDFGAVVNVTSQLTKPQSELLSVFNLLSEEEQYQVIGFAKALAF